MLHCNMNTTLEIQLGLEDLLADLQFARRQSQLGRLALLAYCGIKSWARQAGKPDVAENALKMFAGTPCLSKEEFLAGIDSLIAILVQHQSEYARMNLRRSLDSASVALPSPQPFAYH
jgi:hypothetical protein